MPSVLGNLQIFYTAQATLTSASPVLLNGRSIYKFSGVSPVAGGVGSVPRIPLHVRTGAQSMGNPTERKKFKQIEFHGSGTLWCRVYVDNVFICDGSVTLTENPSKDRRLGIPIGTRGYTMDVEFCGDANVRAIEFVIGEMKSTS